MNYIKGWCRQANANGTYGTWPAVGRAKITRDLYRRYWKMPTHLSFVTRKRDILFNNAARLSGWTQAEVSRIFVTAMVFLRYILMRAHTASSIADTSAFDGSNRPFNRNMRLLTDMVAVPDPGEQDGSGYCAGWKRQISMISCVGMRFAERTTTGPKRRDNIDSKQSDTDRLLERRTTSLLRILVKNKTRLITNVALLIQVEAAGKITYPIARALNITDEAGR